MPLVIWLGIISAADYYHVTFVDPFYTYFAHNLKLSVIPVEKAMRHIF